MPPKAQGLGDKSGLVVAAHPTHLGPGAGEGGVVGRDGCGEVGVLASCGRRTCSRGASGGSGVGNVWGAVGWGHLWGSGVGKSAGQWGGDVWGAVGWECLGGHWEDCGGRGWSR